MNNMEIIRIPSILQDTTSGLLLRGRSIGFVPTMGALHEGHLSLIRRSRQENDKTVVSIFVNPLQFGPSEDFERYPRDFEGDTDNIRREGVDILFIPDALLMYPEGFSTRIEVGRLSDKLCGAFRPGHFSGVATVVAKLFQIVKPARAYFGQKDYQQAVIIRRMVRDLNMDLDVVLCPTIREKDGLALSSRNAYLQSGEREAAVILYRSMQETADHLKSGIIEVQNVGNVMHEKLLREPAISKIDYAGAYDAETLDELREMKNEVLLAVAAWIGNTRLIDNMIVNMRNER